MRALPRKHRVCVVLFPWLHLVYTLNFGIFSDVVRVRVFLTNIGFVQCYSLGSRFVCTLCQLCSRSDVLVCVHCLTNMGFCAVLFTMGMVMKLVKVLCCMFYIVLFLGLDPVQNTIVVYPVLRNQPIEACWLRNSRIVYEGKTKDCVRSWTLQHTCKSCHLCLFL